MPKPKATVTPEYDKARPTIETGDILLFSGKGGISQAIKWFTHSKWSHVGMVFRLTDVDLIMLWESTTLSDLDDYESGHPSKGVQLVVLSERVMKYNGPVALRRLDFDRPRRRSTSSRSSGRRSAAGPTRRARWS